MSGGNAEKGVPRNMQVCDEGVTRRGEFVPCEKTAVAVRIDPEYGTWYAVCRKHTRADMVPLSSLLVAFALHWDPRATLPRSDEAS